VRLVAALALLCMPAAAHATRVLVYDLAAPELEARQLVLLDAALRSEIGKLEGIEVVTRAPEPVESRAEDSCPDQRPTCLVQLAQALGADIVVIGNATALGATRVFTLKRIRIADASVEGTVARRFTGGRGEEYLLVLGDAVRELFPDRQMRSERVRGVPYAVAERWEPPPVPEGIFWGGAAVSAAGAIGTGLLWYMYVVAVEDANAYAASAVDAPISGRTLIEKQQTAEDRLSKAYWVGGITGALAVSTAVMYFFTDFGSDADTLRLLGPGAGSTLVTAELRF
jgi:hypothetical protein